MDWSLKLQTYFNRAKCNGDVVNFNRFKYFSSLHLPHYILNAITFATIWRGLWGLAFSNLSIFRKIDTSKSQWLPVVWCCRRNSVFVIWFENLYFCGKNIIHKQQCAQMCGGVACKPGGKKVQFVRRACMPTTFYPPMCLKWCVR